MPKNNHTFTANQSNTEKSSRRTYSKAAEIVQRLPLHRSLSESQAMLVHLTPFWQLWLNHITDHGGLSSACRQSTRLEAWQVSGKQVTRPYEDVSKRKTHDSASSAIQNRGKLIISCDNATNATQIKQRQQSLVEYLNKSLIKHDPSSPLIDKVVVRLRYDETQMSLNVQKSVSVAAMVPVAENSIRAIEVCQKTVSNEELAKSLKQLAITLRSLS